VVDRVEVVEAAGVPGTILAAGRNRIVVAAGEDAIAIVAVRRGDQPATPGALGLRAGDRLD
jgi:methionyl-tRNA formyltransferase